MALKQSRPWGIRNDILFSYVLVSLIALGGIGATTAIFIGIISSSAGPGLGAQAQANLQVQLAVIFITLWEIIVIALLVGIKIANSVVNPIFKLTQMAGKLATHDIKTVALKDIDTDFDREVRTQDQEIVNLTMAFKKLLTTVQKQAVEEAEKKEKKEKS